MSSPLQRKRPCDRCHCIKEKCRWAVETPAICQRCVRLKLECRTNRPVGRVGRKPKLATGNRMLLRPPSSSVSSPTVGTRSVSSPSDVSLGDIRSTRSPQPSASPISVLLSLSAPRHQLEMRPYSHRQLPLFPELNSLEIHFLDAMLHKQIDIDKYLVGPSFRDGHLQAFAQYLYSGMPFLKDAFIACASLVVRNQNLKFLAEDQNIGHKRAAAAIASLRVSRLRHGHDLTTVLIFGVAVVTFALHHSGGRLPLCSYILGLVKPQYDENYSLSHHLGPDGVAFLICLLGTETEGCVIQCETPTIRIRPGDLDHLVDRFIGVSAPLLTYFYDICAAAELARQFYSQNRCWRLDLAIQQRLDVIEQSLRSWHPAVAESGLTNRFGETEVVSMFAQAEVLRLAALLVIHRLRFAYGCQDDNARMLSRSILERLDTVVEVTGKSIPFAELPHLVACFEIVSPEERSDALRKSHMIVDFSPHVWREHDTWLRLFWAARDRHDGRAIWWPNVADIIKSESCAA